MNFNQQRNLLLQQQRREQAWSARQAQRQMQFQERMSSTAHTREVQDLINAGLNPVLSSGGNGAASGNGAMATSESILPELMEILRSSVASHGSGGTKVVINEDPVERPSQYFTPRQMVQGVHAGQGVHHDAGNSSANALASAHRVYNEAKEEMWEAIKDVNFSASTPFRKGALPRVTANGSGEDLHKVWEAYKKLNQAKRMNHDLVYTKDFERFREDLSKGLKKLKGKIDYESYSKLLSSLY